MKRVSRVMRRGSGTGEGELVKREKREKESKRRESW